MMGTNEESCRGLTLCWIPRIFGRGTSALGGNAQQILRSFGKMDNGFMPLSQVGRETINIGIYSGHHVREDGVFEAEIMITGYTLVVAGITAAISKGLHRKKLHAISNELFLCKSQLLDAEAEIKQLTALKQGS